MHKHIKKPNKSYTRQVIYKTGHIQERSYTREVVYKTGHIQDKSYTRQVIYKTDHTQTGHIQDRSYTRQVIYKTASSATCPYYNALLARKTKKMHKHLKKPMSIAAKTQTNKKNHEYSI